jgi:hypothetical protein
MSVLFFIAAKDRYWEDRHWEAPLPNTKVTITLRCKGTTELQVCNRHENIISEFQVRKFKRIRLASLPF